MLEETQILREIDLSELWSTARARNDPEPLVRAIIAQCVRASDQVRQLSDKAESEVNDLPNEVTRSHQPQTGHASDTRTPAQIGQSVGDSLLVSRPSHAG